MKENGIQLVLKDRKRALFFFTIGTYYMVKLNDCFIRVKLRYALSFEVIAMEVWMSVISISKVRYGIYVVT